MPDVYDWIQLPGKSIEGVSFSSDERVLEFQLSNVRCASNSEYVTFESSDPNVPLVLFSVNSESKTCRPLDPMTLLGGTISEVSVPYVLPGTGLETYLEILFADRSLIRIRSEDPTIPIRLS